MDQSVSQELAALEGMTTTQLCQRYEQLYGYPVRTRHKTYLIRKVAWRIQALAEGDLSERARRRAAELANDADVRVMPPRGRTPHEETQGPPGGVRVAQVAFTSDPRLPAVGTALVRQYKGRTIRVIVQADGFEFDGQRYRTLTAVAEAITGSHINGFRFFRLEGKP